MTSYTILAHKTRRQIAGCGLIKGPSGTCIIPKSRKKIIQATIPRFVL